MIGQGAMVFDRALGVRTTAAPSGPRWPFAVTLPDLGVDIGSAGWWRGSAQCAGLCALAIAFAPGFHTLRRSAVAMPPRAFEEQRALAITPLAWGADSGRHRAATDAVAMLAGAPERPRLDLTATLGQGDGLAHALQRAGVRVDEAEQVTAMARQAVDIDALGAGTSLAITLGRRDDGTQTRPLDAVSFRARLDLRLVFVRRGSALVMQRELIPVDRAPLRITGQVGDGLYDALRAAGAPPIAVQNYIRALAPQVPMDAIATGDRFSMVVEQARAATGEVEYGKLLYVGLDRVDDRARPTRMIEWTIDGRLGWFDERGVGQARGGFTMPVSGAHKTSGFGMRMHPLLGYSRMHQGTDYGAAYGSPIRAVSDGVVAFAGWHGGHGNMVKLAHAGGLGTGYAHMSRMVVAPGTRVAQGQVIGYVGSTGLSTGPHLHFEVYRSGVPINPDGVSFQSTPLLSGAALAAFTARLHWLAGDRVQVAAR